MLNDVVVDTNVWVHSQNPSDKNFQEAVAFLKGLWESSTKLCVDRFFDITGSQNSSLIGHEYIEHVRPTGVGYTILSAMYASARVKSVPDKVPEDVRKFVEKTIPRNKHDRRFVVVAYNSDERRLVSHDNDDFGEDVRAGIGKRLGVSIQMSSEAMRDL